MRLWQECLVDGDNCRMTHSLVAEASAWPFVKTTVVYEVIDSTSDRAASLVREGTAALPLAVWARSQTQGRGRGGHEWWSDGGSLTFTLAIDPAAHGLTVANEPALALATAVAVIDALDELELGDPSIGIRWPNDVEANGRKLGGILPERIETEHGRRILIGIGLNVETDLAGAPAEVRAMATSLAELRAKPIGSGPSRRLMPAILGQFESILERLAKADPSLHARWNRLDLLREKWVRVDLRARQIAGRGQGIDDQGALCLDNGQERLRVFGGCVLRDDSPLREHPNKQAELIASRSIAAGGPPPPSLWQNSL
jgi:BirA family biotin operon repressor/biotin-[acetyl-CoA-carboxylase] ligase